MYTYQNMFPKYVYTLLYRIRAHMIMFAHITEYAYIQNTSNMFTEYIFMSMYIYTEYK